MAPALVGAFIRCFRVGDQILVGDELHGIGAATVLDLPAILTTYLPSDGCIPLTALFRILMDAGVRLSETELRLPSLLAGSLVPMIVPGLLAGRLGVAAARWLAWLLALSPSLALYSRIVRPYAVVVLLGAIATIAFLRWWGEGGTRWAWLYVGSAALTGWFHLSALPFVGAPVVLAWAVRAGSRSAPRSVPQLLIVSVGAAAAVALFLVPTLSAGTPWVRTSGLDGANLLRPGIREYVAVLQMLFGTTERWAAMIATAIAFGGLRLLWRRDRELAGSSAILFVSQFVTLALLAPIGSANPLVFYRYLQVAAFLVLAWIAVALAAASSRMRASRWGRPGSATFTALALAALVSAGPLGDPRVLWSSYLHDDPFVAFYAPEPRFATREEIPAFYRKLSARPRGEAVVEYLGAATWNSVTLLSCYQNVHRQPVLFSPADQESFFSTSFDFERLVAPTPKELLRAPARWLVIHRDFEREGRRIVVGAPLWLAPGARDRAVQLAGRLLQELTDRWGPSDHSDDEISVWDLERVRAAEAESSRRNSAKPGRRWQGRARD